jgi:hypothetical protein
LSCSFPKSRKPWTALNSGRRDRDPLERGGRSCYSIRGETVRGPRKTAAVLLVFLSCASTASAQDLPAAPGSASTPAPQTPSPPSAPSVASPSAAAPKAVPVPAAAIVSVRIRGAVVSEIEPQSGRIRAGSRIVAEKGMDGRITAEGGSVEAGGDIYRAGSLVGRIERDGTIWRGKDRLGAIEGGGIISFKGTAVGGYDGGAPSWDTLRMIAAVLFFQASELGF